MGASVNAKELEKYLENFDVATKEFDDFLKQFLQEMAERVIRKVKPDTPVDTGALRSSWSLGKVMGSGTDIFIVIYNPMDYASAIEYGHRIVVDGVEVGWYEGRFMLYIAVEDVRRQMPLRFEKAFNEFISRMGIK